MHITITQPIYIIKRKNSNHACGGKQTTHIGHNPLRQVRLPPPDIPPPPHTHTHNIVINLYCHHRHHHNHRRAVVSTTNCTYFSPVYRVYYIWWPYTFATIPNTHRIHAWPGLTWCRLCGVMIGSRTYTERLSSNISQRPRFAGIFQATKPTIYCMNIIWDTFIL